MSRRFGAARSLALDISPLRESKPYRALWTGQVVSLLGTQMRYVAIAFQVFRITGSTVAVGMVGLAEVVPLIAFSILGGGIADVADRRRLIFWAQIGAMVASAALFLASVQGDPSVWLIYAITGVASAVNGMDRPARTAMVPHLVKPEQLSAAMALRQVVFQTTQIAGPALGGVLLAAFDVPVVYAIDAVTFLAAIVALRWVPSQPPVGETALSFSHIKEGLRFAFRTPVLLSILSIDLVAMIFGMPRAVFPELAERTFHLGAAGLGLLYAAISSGALIGALTTGWVKRVRRQGLAVLIAVSVWGLSITFAGLSVASFAITLVLLGVAGWADVISAVFRGTMLQESTPDRLRGRVSAINIMVVTGGPRLGDVEAGIVGGAFGPQASIVVGGLACLAGTAIIAARFPTLRRYIAIRIE